MLGCAMLAAVAAGLFPSIEAAAKAMVGIDRVVQPNLDMHREYKPHYERYIGLYPALRPTFHSDKNISLKGGSGDPPGTCLLYTSDAADE